MDDKLTICLEDRHSEAESNEDEGKDVHDVVEGIFLSFEIVSAMRAMVKCSLKGWHRHTNNESLFVDNAASESPCSWMTRPKVTDNTCNAPQRFG